MAYEFKFDWSNRPQWGRVESPNFAQTNYQQQPVAQQYVPPQPIRLSNPYTNIAYMADPQTGHIGALTGFPSQYPHVIMGRIPQFIRPLEIPNVENDPIVQQAVLAALSSLRNASMMGAPRSVVRSTAKKTTTPTSPTDKTTAPTDKTTTPTDTNITPPVKSGTFGSTRDIPAPALQPPQKPSSLSSLIRSLLMLQPTGPLLRGLEQGYKYLMNR